MEVKERELRVELCNPHKFLLESISFPLAYFFMLSSICLSDADSPLNGQVMPALNAANRMLKGATTSGATGGQATHTHTIALTTGGSSSTINGSIAGAGDDVESSGGHTHNATQTSTAETATPPYYEVVWIIRVK